MATNLYRVPSSTGSQKKFTLSFWWKNNSVQNSDKCFFSSGSNSSNYFMIRTTGNEEIQILNIDNGSQAINYKPNRYYRDANAWYHIVIAIDTTQAGGNRIKMYTNGVRETSFSSSTEPNQDANILYVNDTSTHAIGRKNVTQDKYLQGTLSHYHFTDGYVYDATAFGETDATTGEWTIKTSPSVTYGTNGFFILKDGNSVTDQSGNSNNWQVGNGTLTKTEDNPSNVFATLNALVKSGNSLTNGNLTVTQNSGLNYQNSISTLAVTKGKWYAECKLSNISGLYPGIGIIDVSENCASSGDDNGYFGTTNNPKGIELFAGGYYSTGNNNNASLTSNSTNDIIGIALDLDSATKNIKMYRNGTLITGSSVTPPNPDGGYAFGVTMHSSGSGAVAEWNFGNGYFGTTAVASAGTNASGIGIFEYDVPTGFTALSTKGLNL
jgi:hypothetical protein